MNVNLAKAWDALITFAIVIITSKRNNYLRLLNKMRIYFCLVIGRRIRVVSSEAKVVKTVPPTENAWNLVRYSAIQQPIFVAAIARKNLRIYILLVFVLQLKLDVFLIVNIGIPVQRRVLQGKHIAPRAPMGLQLQFLTNAYLLVDLNVFLVIVPAPMQV